MEEMEEKKARKTAQTKATDKGRGKG